MLPRFLTIALLLAPILGAQEAERCWNVLVDNEGSPTSLAYAGETCLRLGDAARAELLWNDALKADPHCDSALLLRARRRFDEGRLEETLKDLESVAPGMEERGDILILMNHVLWGLDRGEDWARLREHVLRWDRSGVMRDMKAALKPGHEKDPAKVVGSMTRVLERDPRFLEARYLRAVYRRQSQDKEGALADLDAVLTVAPRQDQVLMERMRLHTEIGSMEKALKDMDEVMRLKPQHTLCAWERAKVRFARGDAKGAAEDVEVAMRHYRSCSDLWELRGRVRAQLGDYLHAIDDFYEAMKLNPKNWNALAERGLVQELRGRDDLAAKTLAEVLAKAPQEWERRAEIQHRLEAVQKRLQGK